MTYSIFEKNLNREIQVLREAERILDVVYHAPALLNKVYAMQQISELNQIFYSQFLNRPENGSKF